MKAASALMASEAPAVDGADWRATGREDRSNQIMNRQHVAARYGGRSALSDGIGKTRDQRLVRLA